MCPSIWTSIGWVRPTAQACSPCTLTSFHRRSLVSLGSFWRRLLTSRSGFLDKSMTFMFVWLTESISVEAPGVNSRRRRLPDLRLLDVGEIGEGAELRGHRHPIIALRQHRGLAGDAVAHHGEAVLGAHGEREKA